MEKFGMEKFGLLSSFSREVLISIIIALLSTFFLLYTLCSKGATRGRGRQTQSTILFIGPPGSGKTTLIHTLLYGTAAETVTSFSENELSGDLFNARTSGANNKRRNGGNEKSIFVTFVDFPGVAQWRRPTLQRSSTSGAIVVVVDVSEGVKSDVVSSTADLLFDLFTSQSALSSNQPILIVANKALSTEGSNNGSNKNISLEKLLQKCLEEELVRLRSSRGAVAVAGEDDEDKGGVLGSTAGGGFSFDDKDCCKSQVSWLTIYDTTTSTSSSNKKKKLQLDDLKDWISNVVTA